MSVVPFSESARLRARAGRTPDEGDGFMADLMSGRRGREDYIALIAQYYFVHTALEQAAARLTDDRVVARFVSPSLTRRTALEEDLEFLVGPHWREVIEPLPSTVRYAARLETIARTWPAGFIAHHYIRYMGDLCGCKIIRRVMQARFGFQTNGVGFFLYDAIADPRDFKDRYRDELDAVGWTDDERARLLDEVDVAYRFSSELFTELAASGGGHPAPVSIAS